MRIVTWLAEEEWNGNKRDKALTPRGGAQNKSASSTKRDSGEGGST